MSECEGKCVCVCLTHLFYSQVVWKRLYKTTSGMERGTFYQLHNLINRRNIAKKVKNNMNESEDFLELMVTGHVIACTMEVLGMSSVAEIPSSTVIDSPEEVWMKDDTERKSILNDVASRVVEGYVDRSTRFAEMKQRPRGDGVHAYDCEALSLGLLYLELRTPSEKVTETVFCVYGSIFFGCLKLQIARTIQLKRSLYCHNTILFCHHI